MQQWPILAAEAVVNNLYETASQPDTGADAYTFLEFNTQACRNSHGGWSIYRIELEIILSRAVYYRFEAVNPDVSLKRLEELQPYR
ncbi:hypothetical protein FRX31_030258 [Thalictrum thalictroides]|uniref:Uncharacterized protein n=1 Tax=Thalictrum thalictroides TaxID=46969 RepID=A0A7J6V6X3_THATH|nr:hypothetical protein FRX31_030258 [Thalictrum thalictroides]